jgi:transcriptional regulator with XRE-family HTH domain
VSDSEIRTFYSHLGRCARDAREAAGVTQEQLAAHLGLTRGSVANLEAGRQRVSAYHLVVIAAVLDVPVTALIPATHQARLPAAVRGADPQHLDLLDQLLAAAELHDSNKRPHATP